MPLPKGQFLPSGANEDLNDFEDARKTDGMKGVIDKARQKNPGLDMAVGSVPLIGGAMSASDARDEWNAGNPLTAALIGGLGLAGAGAAGKATIKALRNFDGNFAFNLADAFGGNKRVASEAIEGAQNIPGFHYSHSANLAQTDPRMYGKGIKGEEGARLKGNPDIAPRTYFYTNDKLKEPGLGPNHYTAMLNDVYPQGDSLGLLKSAREANPMDHLTEFERMVKGKGFKGYEGNDAVVYFDPVNVSKHQTGTHMAMPNEGKPMLVDTTEAMPGSMTGHLTGMESGSAHERKLMDILRMSDKIYDDLGFKSKVRETTGYYPNAHTGEVERNLLQATSVEDAPGAEEAVDLVSTLRNVLMGQNARGYSGVVDDAAGPRGIRVNMNEGNRSQIENAIQGLDKKGYIAIPNGEGFNVTHATGTQGMLDDVTNTLDDVGAKAANGYGGAWRGQYNEYEDWLKPGEGLITKNEIIPRLLRNQELSQRVDRTGKLQTLSRFAKNADSGYASSSGFPLSSALQNLRGIVGDKGLRGLVEHVQANGYKGLPAVGAYGLRPDEEQN